MATKVELEQEVEYLRIRVSELETENLALKATISSGCNNPMYFALAKLLQEPRTLKELSDYFSREPRLISQWIFTLKNKYKAEIITLSDGRKQLINDPFSAKTS